MDYKIVIDASHGGSDLGASSNGIIEKDYTLKISQYMKKRFDDLEVPVNLIRNLDETLTPKERVDKALSFYGNEKNVILISNHLNFEKEKGVDIIYALRGFDSLAKVISEELTKDNHYLNKYYQRRLPINPSKDYNFIINDTANLQAIIIEYGILEFLDKEASDLDRMLMKNVEAIIRGVMKYIGVSKEERDINFYVVKSGDTLWSIAKELDITVDELKEMNNLDSNLLSVGQKLKKAYTDKMETEKEFSTYTVKKGDTVYGIANKYNITVAELMEQNNLSSETLSIGQILLIEQ